MRIINTTAMLLSCPLDEFERRKAQTEPVTFILFPGVDAGKEQNDVLRAVTSVPTQSITVADSDVQPLIGAHKT